VLFAALLQKGDVWLERKIINSVQWKTKFGVPWGKRDGRSSVTQGQSTQRRKKLGPLQKRKDNNSKET
jgi:hypothetical protein